MLGIDDNPLNSWLAPWLSSVHIPYEDYGAAIVRQLTTIWSGTKPADLLLPHRLVERRSTDDL
jgi:LacI family transcriptional regulator